MLIAILKPVDKIIFSLVLWSFFGVTAVAQNFTVDRDRIIPSGITEEVDAVTYTAQSTLTINGTLIVNGEFLMDQNKASLILGEGARLIVYGNFTADNQVYITLGRDSYFFVFGNFYKGGSSNQDVVIIDNAKIYILGQETNWGDNFKSCEGNYEGSTSDIDDNCDFGKEDDFEDNQDQFPDDLVEQLNCYDLSSVKDQVLCESQSTIFSVDPIADVNYQWQVKSSTATSWSDIGSNAASLTVSNVTSSMDGNSYRVIVRSPNNGTNCKISISKAAELNVTGPDFSIGSITGSTKVCYSTSNISYSIPVVPNAIYSWNFPAGWTILDGNGTNSVDVQVEENAISGTIVVTVSNECKSEEATFDVSVDSKGKWTGAEDTNWNNINNWSCNALPTLEMDVVIPSGLTNYPVVNTGAKAMSRNITIETGATLTVNNNWLQIAGDLNNSGILSTQAGNISFQGISAQTIPANAFENNRILNLKIDNSAGVTSEATIEIINSLKVEAGIFYTGNGLTLVSGETETAYIDGSGTGQVFGTVTIQRYISNAFGYKYFSTPFQNSTVDDLAANFDLTNSETGFPHLYEYLENRTYNEENDLTGWQKYLDLAAPLNLGTGYAINTSGATDALTLVLSGIVNNGPVNVTLENNNGEWTNGFNLVGNPYPSPVDWDLMVEDLKDIDNSIHFFKASADDRYTGTYVSYVDGVSTDPASGIIPSMQGFFVRVSDPDNGIYPATANLQFTNAARTGNQVSHSYYKAKNKAEIPQIRLSAGFENEENSDATVIYFRNGGTPEFEKEIDAQKILNTAVNVPSLYSLSSKKEKISINAVSSINTEAMEIPLGISSERSGEMRLVLSETTNLFPSLHIYLKDNKKKILKDLARDPEYSFTSQKGENNDRFVLVFSSEKLSPAEIAMAMEDFAVFNENKEFVVRLNLPYYEEGKVILSNMSGQVIQSKSGSGKEEVRFSGITASGMYLVTLTTENESQTKKVIFKE